MDTRYDTAPELVEHNNYPEAVRETLGHSPIINQQATGYQQYYGTPTIKPEQEHGYSASTYNNSMSTTYQNGSSPQQHAHTDMLLVGGHKPPSSTVAEGSKRTICGCSAVVFMLFASIVILVGIVVGLAAGTGIQTNRANEANNMVQNLQAALDSVSSSAAAGPTSTSNSGSSPTSTASSKAIDNGCSTDSETVDGQNYSAFDLLGASKFTMRCNKDLEGNVLMSLFAKDFNSCMDSCSAWSKYTKPMFGENNNTTCSGVRFIPLWASKSDASAGKAPGNCYLKKGALTSKSFKEPNAGTPVHGALLSSLA